MWDELLVNPLYLLCPAGCDMCADNRNGECPMHGPLHSLRRLVGTSSAAPAVPPPDVPDWLRDLPREVCLCTSTVPGLGYGICAAQRIPQGTWIGPFAGVPLLLDKLQSGGVRNTRHLWEVSSWFMMMKLKLCNITPVTVTVQMSRIGLWSFGHIHLVLSLKCGPMIWVLEMTLKCFSIGIMSWCKCCIHWLKVIQCVYSSRENSMSCIL